MKPSLTQYRRAIKQVYAEIKRAFPPRIIPKPKQNRGYINENGDFVKREYAETLEEDFQREFWEMWGPKK